jgi:hypothetical protein
MMKVRNINGKNLDYEVNFVNKSLEIIKFPSIKEKSWASRIVEGHLINGKVRAERCSDCKSSCKLVTFGCGNSNSILYGCSGHKCKHILINVKFNACEPAKT